MKNPLIPNGNRLTAPLAALAFVAALNAGADNFYWRGTADNPVWDTSTANWASDASTSARKAWVNNASSSNPRFDAQGAKDITVAADGVQGMELDIYGGDHTLSGGTVTVNVVDTDGGNLTIHNRLNCTATTSGWGFRMHGGNGTFTVGDGGYLDAWFSPFSGDYAGKLMVLTGGTFRATFDTGKLNNKNHPTIYFDGGTLIHTYDTYQNKVTFGSTKMVLGAGGMHVAERVANGWTYLPGPIGPADDLPDGVTDGGLIVDNLSSSTYVYMQNFAHTFQGGLHLRGTGGCVGIENDRALGATPASPADNLFFEGPSNTVSTILAAHGSATLGANRNLRIGNGVTARLGVFNASSRLTVKGTFSCENPETGFLESRNFSDSTTGVTLDPGAGRTNHVGRLFVHHPLTVASGTTLLESSKYLRENGGDEQWGVNDGSPLHVRSGATLTVTGGELRTSGTTRPVTQNGTLVVSGGLVELGDNEMLHANAGKAVTTVKDGGCLSVASLRIGGTYAGSDASKSVLNVATGGVVRVKGGIYVHGNQQTFQGTVNFDGGTLEWARPHKSWNDCPFGNDNTATKNNVAWNVLAGGMNVTNDVEMWFYPAIRSGVADGETDGGFTKWGTATLALFNTANSFNGPLTAMQGTVSLGDNNVLPATATVRTAAGASFNLNTKSQTVARIEGSGRVRNVVNNGAQLLTVTSAIAPGMGANAPGTLSVDGPVNLSDGVALEIDALPDGSCDCLSYASDLDLTKMALVVNDGTKLDKTHVYTILEIPSGSILSGPFASMTGLPDTWHVHYGSTSVELRYTSPFVLVLR